MKEFKNIYFIGAGGIGMAALERYYLAQGCRVAGYDRTPSALTAELQAEGVTISFADIVDAIPADFRDPATTLAVYTPAVPTDHPVMQFFANGGFEMHKRAQVLGTITRASRAICFAGTHGKTTTSSMCAHILNTSATGCNAFLGGILRNVGSNLILSATSPYSVVEADEYDRSFHQLTPYIAVITATSPDHLDIYGTEESYLEGFARFTELIRPDGALLVHTGLKLMPRPPKEVKVYTYSATEGDFHATNVRRSDGEINIDIVTPSGTITDISLGVPVEINIDNAVAAVAAVWLTGTLDAGSVRRALGTFMGPERRFEFHLKEPLPGGHVLIDDYAHHPEELAASIASVKALYPRARLTVAFQPHLYTRTRDFAPQFAAALSQADEVILVPIYPARELPLPGITSETILKDVTSPVKRLVEKGALAETLARDGFEVLLVAGAGDINLLIPDIISRIKA